MMTRYGMGALIGLLLIFTACEEADLQIGQDDEGSLVLGTTEVDETVTRGVSPGGRVLALEGYRGHIRLEGAGGESAELQFTKRARGEDQEGARQTLNEVEVEETGGDDEYLYRMTARDEDRSTVDVEGTVPHNTRLRIRMDSGQITMSGVSGPLDIETQNGHVTLAGVATSARVRVQNGQINVGMRDLPQDSEVDLETSNGHVYFTMPGHASVRIDAETQAGNIRVDGLDFTNRQLSPRAAGASFSGQLGTGQVPVRLRTRNGFIYLQEGTVEDVDLDLDPTEEQLHLFPDTEDPDTSIIDQDTLRDPLPSDTVGLDTTAIF